MKRRSSSPVTSALLLLTVLFLLPLSCSAKRAPLCHEVLGFAESINHEFILSITAAPREGEAIVLLAHPFPDQEEGLVLNATYRLRTGNSIVTRVADADNVLILTDVAENSEMHVGILRAKTDGPVPFRFVSYHANSPICSIMVSPTHSFSSRVPNRLPNGQVATVFFHANPPASVNAAVIFAHEGTGTRVADGILSFREDPSAMRYTETESGEVLQGDAGQPLHFAFTPDPVSTSNKRLHISLQWAEVVNGGGQKTGKRNTNHPPPQKGGTSFAKVVFVVLVLGFIAATAYNYVVLHKRDVAEVVPLAGFLSTVGDHVMFMARNPRSADRSGYQHMG